MGLTRDRFWLRGRRPRSISGRWLVAQARDDQETLRKLGRSQESDGAIAVVREAFQLVVQRVFAPAHDVTVVSDLIRHVCDRYPLLAERINRSDAEILVRAARGEPVSTQHIDEAEAYFVRCAVFEQ